MAGRRPLIDKKGERWLRHPIGRGVEGEDRAGAVGLPTAQRPLLNATTSMEGSFLSTYKPTRYLSNNAANRQRLSEMDVSTVVAAAVGFGPPLPFARYLHTIRCSWRSRSFILPNSIPALGCLILWLFVLRILKWLYTCLRFLILLHPFKGYNFD